MLNKSEEYYIIGCTYTSYYSDKSSYFYNILSKSFLDRFNITDKMENIIKKHKGNTKYEVSLGELEGKHSDCYEYLTFDKISLERAIKLISEGVISDSNDAYEVYETFTEWILDNDIIENEDENDDDDDDEESEKEKEFWKAFTESYDLDYKSLKNIYKNNFVKITSLINSDDLLKGKMSDGIFMISYESNDDLKIKLNDFIKTL